MVNVNELRMGNWVYALSPVTIKDEPKQIEIDSFPFAQFYKPILLTPEILEKCGFVKQPSSDNVVDLYFYGTNPINGDFLITLNWVRERQFPFYQNRTFELKSLHQLQNLYFALTGDELEINL
jgi:hypothetical protein